jgi:hypothetical protein
MSNPLFKRPDEPLSPLEEAEITKELAEAYRLNENCEKQPEFKRIAENIKNQIQKENP